MTTRTTPTSQRAASPRRVRGVPVRDAAIAVMLFVLFLLGATTLVRLAPDFEGPGTLLTTVVGAGMTLPLACRRLAPRTVMFVVTAAFSAHMLTLGGEATVSSLALFVAIYTVGAELPPERSRRSRAAVIVLMFLFVAYSALAPVLDIDFGPSALAGFDWAVFVIFSVLLNLAFFGAAWIIGDLVWKARQDEQKLEERAVELAASRELLAERAVQDERVRIARELHDVVAHHVSVMGIQAGAARRAVERDPKRAAEALTSVEQSSRDAVAELQRLLGFLRDGDDALGGPAPQPTLADLDDLVNAVRDVGLDVDVVVSGERRELPDTVELSAYRIVQEALTNTLRHAHDATRAEVRLAYETDRLRILVRDDGIASSRVEPDTEGGRGLVGMRERASLHAGKITATSRPGGGFVVDGWLPIREAHQ